MNIIVFIGMPCSGKTTVSRMVARQMKLPRISSGDIARQIAEIDQDTHKSLASGGMANEELMRAEIFNRLCNCRDSGDRTVILDGFPRNIDQHMFLLERFPNDSLYYICVACNESVARARNMARMRDDWVTFDERMHYYQTVTMSLIGHVRNYDILFAVDGVIPPFKAAGAAEGIILLIC